jgi:hypothetical protein
VPVRKRLKFGKRLPVDLAAMLMHTAEQCASRPAEGAVSPASALVAGVAFPPLQNPLQRIIDDPPSLVELGYKGI